MLELGISGDKFFFEGQALGDSTKKDLKKVVLSENYTYILNYPENFNFIVFGVRMQNYFNVQVHAHTVVPKLLTGTSWFLWNNLTLISTKMIAYTSKY